MPTILAGLVARRRGGVGRGLSAGRGRRRRKRSASCAALSAACADRGRSADTSTSLPSSVERRSPAELDRRAADRRVERSRGERAGAASSFMWTVTSQPAERAAATAKMRVLDGGRAAARSTVLHVVISHAWNGLRKSTCSRPVTVSSPCGGSQRELDDAGVERRSDGELAFLIAGVAVARRLSRPSAAGREREDELVPAEQPGRLGPRDAPRFDLRADAVDVEHDASALQARETLPSRSPSSSAAPGAIAPPIDAGTRTRAGSTRTIGPGPGRHVPRPPGSFVDGTSASRASSEPSRSAAHDDRRR